MIRKIFITLSASALISNIGAENLIKNHDFEGETKSTVYEDSNKSFVFYRLASYFANALQTAAPAPASGASFSAGEWYVKAENSGYFRLFLRNDDGYNSDNCAELTMKKGSTAINYDTDFTKLAITQRISAERKIYKLSFDAKRVESANSNHANKVYPFIIPSNAQTSMISTDVALIDDYEWHRYETIIDLSTAANTNDWALGIGLLSGYEGVNAAGKPLTCYASVKLDNIVFEEFKEEINPDENLFAFDFNNDLSKQWNTNDGTLSITDEHFTEGTRALNWQISGDNAQLSVSFTEGFKLNNNAFFFSFYNKKSYKDGKMKIEFLSSGGEILRTINIDMDFTGWRDYKRTYEKDFAEIKSGDVSKVNFIVTNAPDAYICFDNVNFIASNSSFGSFNDLFRADIEQIKNGTNRMCRSFALIPSSINYEATTEEVAALEGLRNIHSVTTPSYNFILLTSAKKYVTEMNIQRNQDGTIKGCAINTASNNTDFWSTLTQNLEILAYGAQNNPESYRAYFDDLVDQIIEQGLFYNFEGFTYSDYTSLRTIPKRLLNSLPACNENQKTELLRAAQWFVEYGTIYDPSYNVRMSSDYIYNILQYPFVIAANQPDNNIASGQLRSLSEYLANATEYTPGNIGFLKPDGCGFHHNSHYINYMYSFKSFNTLMGSLKGTPFRVSADGYERFRKAIISQFLMASRNTGSCYTANSLAGRHPIVGGNLIQFTKADFDELILTGGDIYGTGIDKEAAAAYNYFFYDNKYNVEEINFEGYYQFNYSPVGVYRHDNWVATMRTPTTKFWGAEIYSKTNRLGRYQSHGTLEIVYNNSELTASGLPAKAEGWDWNVVPGATTVHYTDWTEMMPNRSLTDRFDQYAKTTNFAGALAWEDCGMYGSEFDQIDTWGGQRFTPTNLTFKKSVYAFDGILISLGSDISTSGSYSDAMITATNLFQSVNPSSALLINGTEMKNGDEEKILANDNYAILTPEGTGYFIPSGNDDITVRFGTQSAPNETGADITNPATVTAAKAYINHGVKQSGKKYSFVVMPGTDKDKLSAMAEKMKDNGGEIYTVQNQNEDYHALRYHARNILAASVFKAQTLSLDDVCETGSEMLIMQRKENEQRVSFAITNPNLRPQQITTDGVSHWISTPTETFITLNGEWYIVTDSDESIRVVRQNNTTLVYMTITDGEPVYFALDKDEDNANIPSGIDTAKNEINLFAVFSKTSKNVTVKWQKMDVNRIDIVNLFGQVISTRFINSNESSVCIPMKQINNGCFFIVAHTDQGRKIIKQSY